MRQGGESDAGPILNIVGQRVALGPLHRGLLPLIERWDSDFRTTDLGGEEPRPRTTEALSALLESMLRGERSDWIGFALYALPDLRPIGWANIRDFTNPHGTAEFGIEIGDSADRGHGYGTEAVQLLVDYAFTVLGVHNVWLDTPAYNAGAIRAYEKAGFREIGRRRGARVLAGHRYDVVLMDCVVDEFVPPARRAVPNTPGRMLNRSAPAAREPVPTDAPPRPCEPPRHRAGRRPFADGTNH